MIRLEEEMATHSSILVWRRPWTEEPGGLQSMGSQTVGHNWATNTSAMIRCLSCRMRAIISANHFSPSRFDQSAQDLCLWEPPAALMRTPLSPPLILGHERMPSYVITFGHMCGVWRSAFVWPSDVLSVCLREVLTLPCWAFSIQTQSVRPGDDHN